MALDFKTARRRVCDSMKRVFAEFRDYRASNDIDRVEELQKRHLLIYIVAPQACSAILFIVTLALSLESPIYAGLITTVVLLLFFSIVVNVFIVLRLEKTEREEVGNDVDALVSDYESYLQAEEANSAGMDNGRNMRHTQNDGGDIFLNTSNLASVLSDPSSGFKTHCNNKGITSGHSHISIVTTYRNKTWQRIPTLLLAEGDVVALMGGDVTPGDVYELIPFGGAASPIINLKENRGPNTFYHSSSSEMEAPLYADGSLQSKSLGSIGSAGSGSGSGIQGLRSSKDSTHDTEEYTNTRLWRRGRLWKKGCKVPLRTGDDANFSPYAGHSSQERQRSIAPDSVELLVHSGDIRCFQLAETPISAFIRDIYSTEGQNEGLNKSGIRGMGEGMSIFPLTNSCTVGHDAPFFGLFSTIKPYSSALDGVSVGAAGVKIDHCAQSSILRSLIRHVLRRSMELLIILTILFVITGLIRMYLLIYMYGKDDPKGYSNSGELVARWPEYFLSPVGVMCMVIAPVSLPLVALFLESLVTADLLSTIELILQGEEEEDTSDDDDREYPFAENSVAESEPKTGGRTSQDTRRVKRSGTYHDDVNSTQVQRTSSADDFSDDSDFDDDDIDEKIEAETREDRANTSIWRVSVYVLHVLSCRLGINIGTRSLNTDIDTDINAKEVIVNPGEDKTNQQGAHSGRTETREVLDSKNSRNATGRRRSYWHTESKSKHGSSRKGSNSEDRTGSKGNGTSNSSELLLLPVPMIKTRLLEVLGGVTMVCFVDDDIVCEGYSVTEEVFLLKPAAGDEISGIGSAATTNPSNTHTSNTLEDSMAMGPTAGASGARGLVLDLHANPDAKGSRFENPLWWQYLPSLKPVGLSALLTYKASAVPSFVAGSDAIFDETEGQMAGDFPSSLAKTNLINSNVIHFNGEYNNSHARKAPSAMEKQLVHHTRRAIPLESMRELAEEIGFSNSDVEGYTRFIETNIVAPALSDRKLLVDAHSWGQEETRRRGTLTSAARGVVVGVISGGGANVSNDASTGLTSNSSSTALDPRFSIDKKTPGKAVAKLMQQDKNSPEPSALGKEDLSISGPTFRLQMMTQGDPSLILSYSKEYWDGKSITPLSAADRREVLNVSERWALEDFDVVALSYAPVDPYLQESIAQLHSYARSTFSSDAPPSSKSNISAETVPALFYLDPRNYEQLNGLKGNRAKKEHQHARTVPSTRVHDSSQVLTHYKDTRSDVTLNRKPDDQPDINNVAYKDHTDDPNNNTCVRNFGSDTDSVRDPLSNAGQQTVAKRKTSDQNLASPMVAPAGDRLQDGTQFLVTEKEPALSISSSVAKDPKVLRDDQAEEESVTSDSFSNSQVTPLLSHVPSEASHMDHLPSSVLASASNSIEDFSNVTVLANAATATATATATAAAVVKQDLHPTPNDRKNESQAQHSSHYSSLESRLDDEDKPVCDVMSLDSGTDTGTAQEYSTSAKTAANTATDLVTEKSANGSDELYTLPTLHTTQSLDTGLDSTRIEILRRKYDKRQDFPPSPPELQAELDWSTGNGHIGDKELHEIPSRSGEVNSKFVQSDSVDMRDLDTVNRDSLNMPKRSSSPRGDTGLGIRSGRRSDTGPIPKVTTEAIRQHDKYLQEQQRVSGTSGMMNSISKTMRRLSRSVASGLWPTVKTQIFLGMTASSVPVRQEVPELMEDLTAAGVRFVYFSPRNMRRSKPVAEKIGITFDWNCAVSLRPLSRKLKRKIADAEDEEETDIHQAGESGRNTKDESDKLTSGDVDLEEHLKSSEVHGEEDEEEEEEEEELLRDPHRHISNYADWVVHARMPHGVSAINKHLQEVDNVPLLVNLYTDSTPHTTRQMLEIFKSYGEVVLAVGSSYRADNNRIFRAADLGVVVSLIPGDTDRLCIHGDAVLSSFPCYSENSLTRSDLSLPLRMVAVGASTTPLLQTPITSAACLDNEGALNHDKEGDSLSEQHFLNEEQRNTLDSLLRLSKGPRLRITAILEAVRKGRVLLYNALQALAVTCLVLVCMTAWPIVSLLVPIAIPPSLSPPLAIIFIFVYLPCMLCISLTAPAPDAVLKNTPKKGFLNFDNDTERRFIIYLIVRAGWVLLSVLLTGWLTAASLHDDYDSTTGERLESHFSESLSTFITGYLATDEDNFALLGGSFPASGEVIGDLNKHSHQYRLWLVQDMMSAQLLLSLLCQQATLLRRGQGRSLPELTHRIFVQYPATAYGRLLDTLEDIFNPKIDTVDGHEPTASQYIGAVLSSCTECITTCLCLSRYRCNVYMSPFRGGGGEVGNSERRTGTATSITMNNAADAESLSGMTGINRKRRPSGSGMTREFNEGAEDISNDSDQEESFLKTVIFTIREHTHSIFMTTSIIIVHGAFLYVRTALRYIPGTQAAAGSIAGGTGLALVDSLELPVWLSLVLLPLLGLLVGVLVNIDDYKYYQQALTFQRLDFDTKLGMHSPR